MAKNICTCEPCYCKVIMGLAVVVLAWVNTGFNAWLLTILGLLIAAMSAMGVCCNCAAALSKVSKKKK